MPASPPSQTSRFFSPILNWFKPITHYFKSSDQRYQNLKKDDDYDLEQNKEPKEDSSFESQQLSNWQLMMRLSEVTFNQENASQFLAVGCLTLMNIGLNFLSPYLLSETIELYNSKEDERNILGMELEQQNLVLLLLMSYTLSQLIPNLTQQLMTSINMRNAEREVEKIAKHLLQKSLDYHVTTASSEQNRLFQKSFTVSNVGSPILTTIFPKMVEVLSASAFLSRRYGSEIGLSLLAMLFVYSAYSLRQVDTIIKNRELSLQKNNESWHHLEGSIKNYKVMHDFNKFEYTLDKLHESQMDFINHYIKAENFPKKVAMRQTLLVRSYMLATCLYVANQIKSGHISVSSFVALVGYFNQLSNSLPQFGQSLNEVIAAIPDLNFVFSELEKGAEIDQRPAAKALPIKGQEGPEIEFSEVLFQYPSAESPCFSQMSFVVQPGEFVALVSESGVGKTTLFNLLYGHYQADHGEIKINQSAFSDTSLQSWQQSITIFGQRPELFKGSIRENIAYGAKNPEDVSDEQIWQMARKANLDSFIEGFPLKLDEQVGDNGKALSGGQQQKVAILRGMLKQSPIRLLDEITASCDSLSAEQVMNAIASSREDTTTMMITHKLSEVRHADRIIVIGKQGLIAEGTHEALLQTCELYARLCNSASSPKVDNNKSSSTKKMAAHLGPFGKSKQTPQPEVTESSQQAILLEERQEPETLNTPDLESALTI